MRTRQQWRDGFVTARHHAELWRGVVQQLVPDELDGAELPDLLPVVFRRLYEQIKPRATDGFPFAWREALNFLET